MYIYIHLRLGRLQGLVGNPQQVRVRLDVHAEVLGILEHVRDGALEVVLKGYKQELGTIRDGLG